MITVLMTIYNENKKIIQQSIESILNQTYKNFIFLIILDNPNNFEAKKLLEEYEQKDKRIKYFINEINLGLPLSLNRGIQIINTKYIARMDADDIALPERLEYQLRYMESNENIDLLGTNIHYFNDEREFDRSKIPEKSETIRKVVRYANIMCHPTFFFKSDVLKKEKYRNLRYSQDYDLVCRLIEKGYKVANINKYLLNYRLTKNSNSKDLYQRICMLEVQKYYKRKKINDIDIEKIVTEKISHINNKEINRYVKSLQFFNLSIKAKKSKKFFSMVAYLASCFFLSKYQRRHILNLLILYTKKYY